MNVMATAGAGAVAGKDGRAQPVVPPVTIFPETAHKHADSWFYDTAPSRTDKRDQAMRLNYKQASKPIQDQIIRAAINHPKFKSKEDVQSFVQGLDIDERFGQLAENTITTWLEKANPDLMNSIRGDQEVQRVNDQIIINFVRQHSTARGADQMSNEQVLAAAKADPALMQQLKREGVLMVQGPNHKPMAQPFTEEQKAERKTTAQTKEWQLLKEANDAFAAQHPDFASRLNPQTGEPQLMAKEELIKEQNKAALEQHREERATQIADIQALAEERAAKKAALEDSPQYKRIVRENEQKARFFEARLKLIEGLYLRVLELETEDKADEGRADKIYDNALKRLEEDPRYKPTPLPGEEPTMPSTGQTVAVGRPKPVSSITDQQGRVITPVIANLNKLLSNPNLIPQQRQDLQAKVDALKDEDFSTQGGVAPSVEPVIPKLEPKTRAKILESAPIPSDSDLMGFARQKAKEGALSVARFGEKALYNLLALLTLPATVPYAAGQEMREIAKKIPDEVMRKLVDLYQQDWVDKQMTLEKK